MLTSIIVIALTMGVWVSPASSAPVSISGTVSSAGAPVSGIEVRLYREPGRVVVGLRTTDAQGAYTFSGLTDGSYRLRFADPGDAFETEFWNDAASYSSATAIDLSGATAHVADADLAPRTSISGALTDSFTGEALAGVQVRLYREPGRVVVGEQTSALDGSYRFSRLAAGSYRLRFQDPSGSYRTEFWDGATYYSGASDIVLDPGEMATADATIVRNSWLSVGVDRSYHGLPAAGLEVRLFREPGRVPSGDRTVPTSGSHVQFADLEPGIYRVRVTDPRGYFAREFYLDAPVYSAGQDIVVHGGTSVHVTVDPAHTAPLDLTVDAGDDGVDIVPGDGVCDAGGGRCTLRAAIMESNHTAATDTVRFTPGLRVTLAIPGRDEDAALTGDLDVTDPLVIEGNGGSVDAAGLDRIFDLRSLAEVSDLELSGGAVVGTAAGGAVRGRGALVRSTVRDSSAAYGGGISGSLDLDSSTIVGNTATVEGGGIALTSGAEVVNSSITGNVAPVGAAASVQSVTVRSSTISSGSATSAISGTGLTVGGTILDAATGTACEAGVVSSLGWNVVTDGSCRLGAPGDREGRIARLHPLTDDGGATQTLPLGSDSIALDAIPNGTTGLCDGSIASDQRGVERPQGPACDVGASEGNDGPAPVRVWTVDTSGDLPDSVPGDGFCDVGDGTCSLRAAASEANAAGGADVIELAATTSPVLSIIGPGEDGNASGDIDLTGLVELRGGGGTIDAAGIDRVLDHVGTTGGITVIDTVVTGGALAGADDRGAGIRASSAVALIDSTVSGNVLMGSGLTRGAGLAVGPNGSALVELSTVVANSGAVVGGGLSADVNTRVTIVDSTITQNVASDDGGGLHVVSDRNAASVLRLAGSTIDHNGASLHGGGIATDTDTAVEADAIEVRNNTAASGAGMSVSSLALRDSVVEQNVGTTGGGLAVHAGSSIVGSWIRDNQASEGGGIWSDGSLTIEASTISGNSSTSSGGGAYAAAPLTLVRSTVSGNTAPAAAAVYFASTWVTVSSSTVAANSGAPTSFAGVGSALFSGSILSATTQVCGAGGYGSGGFNVVTDGSCGPASSTDQIGANPVLAGLADNGGSTATHLPAANGAGVDQIPAGTPGLCDASVTEDQRGVGRPVGAACDIGAVEGAGPLLLGLNLTVTSAADGVDKAPGDGICATAGNTCTLRAAVMEANARPSTDTVLIGGGLSPTITRAGLEDAAVSGDLDVTDFLTIDGGGAVLDARSVDRAFDQLGAALTIRDLTIVNGRLKTAGTGGGGVRAFGVLTFEDGAIIGSTSVAGTYAGAISVESGGRATIQRSTLAGNHPGAVEGRLGATVMIEDSTVSGNSSTSIVGAGELTASTVVTTTRAIDGPMVVSGSVIAGALAPACGTTPPSSAGWNIVSDTSCAFAAAGDLQGVGDPRLWPLEDNGGPTSTHVPGANSPAIDHIPVDTPGLCDGSISVDQRGADRLAGVGCDSGAVEGAGPPRDGLALLVDTPTDDVDLVPGDRLCATASGTCSLRAAISEANADPLLADTVTILPGVDPVLSIIGVDDLANASGDLNVNGLVAIVGSGNRVDASAVERGISIDSGALTVNGISLVGGTGWNPGFKAVAPLTLTDVVIEDTVASGGSYSAPVQVDGASLDVVRTIIRNNSSASGSSAVFVFDGDATIVDSAFEGNVSGSGDAAVHVNRGTVSITGTSIADNGGKGVLVQNLATGTIASSTIARHSGTGLDSFSTDLVVTDTAILEDSVRSSSSGLLVRNSTIDGGAALTPTEALVSTVSGGRVRLESSTLSATSGEAVLRRGTSGGAQSGALELQASIVDGAGVAACNASSTVTLTDGWNLVGDASCTLAGPGDLVAAPPLLGPLQSSGSNRWIRLPDPASPAVDHIPLGTAVVCDGTWPIDQRGLSRPQGLGCDVGSVEQ